MRNFDADTRVIVSIIPAAPGWRVGHYDIETKEIFYSSVGAWALVKDADGDQEVQPLLSLPDSIALELINLKEAPCPVLVAPGHEAVWDVHLAGGLYAQEVQS